MPIISFIHLHHLIGKLSILLCGDLTHKAYIPPLTLQLSSFTVGKGHSWLLGQDSMGKWVLATFRQLHSLLHLSLHTAGPQCTGCRGKLGYCERW